MENTDGPFKFADTDEESGGDDDEAGNPGESTDEETANIYRCSLLKPLRRVVYESHLHRIASQDLPHPQKYSMHLHTPIQSYTEGSVKGPHKTPGGGATGSCIMKFHVHSG